MAPPHGLRNSSLLKAKVLKTGILSVSIRKVGSPGLLTAPPSCSHGSLPNSRKTIFIGFPFPSVFLAFSPPLLLLLILDRTKILPLLPLQPPYPLPIPLTPQCYHLLLLHHDCSLLSPPVWPDCAVSLCLIGTLKGNKVCSLGPPTPGSAQDPSESRSCVPRDPCQGPVGTLGLSSSSPRC